MEFEEEEYPFHPTDSELLTFLLRFIAEKDLLDDGFITECDVYKQEPWITYSYGCHCGGEDDGDTRIYRYFISPRHKKKQSNERFCRVVGENLGTWKQQDKGKKVTMKEGNSLNIGLKKSLYYDTHMCCPNDGKWLMKEYVFGEAILTKFKNSKFRDYCICAIKMKFKKRCAKSTNINSCDEEKLDTGVNCVEPWMNRVEPMMQIQEASSGEENDVWGLTTFSHILENDDDPVIRDMWKEYMEMIRHDPNKNPLVEYDDLQVQIQENAMPKN